MSRDPSCLRVVGIGAFGLMLSPSADLRPPIAQYLRVHDRGKNDPRHLLCRKAWQEHGAVLVPDFAALVAEGDFDVLTICAGKNADDCKIISQVLPLINERCSRKPIILHLSTVSAGFATAAHQACNQHDIPYVNYPLTGGPSGAKEHTMLILASGDLSIYQTLERMLQAIGTPRHFGSDPALGAIVKLIGHHLVFNGLTGALTAAGLHCKSFNIPLAGEGQADFFKFLNQGAGGTAQIPKALLIGIEQGKWDTGFLAHHAAVDAIYAALLAKELGLSARFSVQPMIHMALALAFLLDKHQDKPPLATHAIARELLNHSQELDQFIDRFDHDNDIESSLTACVQALPEAVRNSVMIDICPESFAP